jgi:glycosyltransferase involved in cell wall biosynthesis
MGYIRWLQMSAALARHGHEVDIATAEEGWHDADSSTIPIARNLRRVRLDRVRWNEYDVIKTLFHVGFETLERHGGARHPFIVSKLGSVVGPADMPGIYFYGERRARLFDVQIRISRTSRAVVVVSEPARDLWRAVIGGPEVFVVPGAAEANIPMSAHDPFPDDRRQRCLFAGNVYSEHSQPEANAILINKLNRLGRALAERGICLYMIGHGDVSRLDSDAVTYIGTVPYEEAWGYLRFAHVGVVVAAGAFMHNNESTKIYHYLRAGLPVVSEAGFPNDHVVRESGLGIVVANGDLDAMADRVVEATAKSWDRDSARQYVLAHHTWDRRADVYDALIAKEVGARTA